MTLASLSFLALLNAAVLRIRAAVLLLVLASVGVAQAQTSEKKDKAKPEPESQRWLRDYYANEAAKYEFFVDEARTIPMTFVEKPIFRWKQDNDWSGDVFVWTHQGRPQMVGCILASLVTAGTRSVAHEFHSLALQGLPRTPMVANGSWKPEMGLKLIPFDETAPPATSFALRLTQMRALARDFTSVMKVDEKEWELRWLPQPIYRYSAPDAKVIDGGLFAYVWTRGTDPEMLLMLECRDEKPQPRWYFAPVNFTSRPLRLTLKDREVWNSLSGGGWTTGESTKLYQPFSGGRVTVPADQR